MSSAATTIERKPVQSSNIKSVGYDSATKKLHVEFHVHDNEPTRVYEYSGVSPEAHEAFVNAASIGSHFHRNIRSKYEGVRVEGGAR